MCHIFGFEFTLDKKLSKALTSFVSKSVMKQSLILITLVSQPLLPGKICILQMGVTICWKLL